MMSTAGSMFVLLIADSWPASGTARRVMLVPPARSMPRRGVVCPERNIPPVSATMAIRMRASERPGLLWALELRPLLGAATFSYSLSGRLAPDLRAGGHHMVSVSRASCARSGAHGGRPARPGVRLLRAGVAVGLLRLFVRLGLGGRGLGGLLGRVLLTKVDGLVVGGGGSVVGGLVGLVVLGEGGGVVRDDVGVGLQVVLDAVDDAVVLVVGENGTDRVLREEQLDARTGVDENRVLVDFLDRRVHAPDRADATAGLHLI